MLPQVPAILLCCQEYDELKVPSSPPRRLSRSSIDLRDLEAQHEREKIMSQNVSESVSSIYHCFDSQIRYSESEPINAHIKALENQFSNNGEEQQQPDKNHHHQQQQHQQQLSAESKSSMNNFSFMNNFEHNMATGTAPTTKESDMNLISSASIIKDNHQVNANNNNNNGSNGNSNNSKKSFKKKMLASSDSDFFSLLRYNSVKLRRMNCFSIGSTNGNGNNQAGGPASVGSGGDSCSANGNKPKNMIYALSDSDFLIRVNDSDNNKTFHLNNERKLQAIVNKSDIFNYLNKSFDHNLLDYNSAQHNQKKLTDKPFHGDLEFFNADKLKKVFEESQQKIDADDNNVIIASSNNSASIISSEKLQKKETVSLPPLVNSTSNDINLKLNNSRSIDTVLLNIKNSNNADKLYTFKLLHDFSPKAINQEENLNKNLLKDSIQRQSTIMTTSSGSDVDIHPPPNAATSALTPNNGNNNNNNHSSLSIPAVDSNAPPPLTSMSSHLLKPVNLNDSSLNGQQQNLLDLASIDSNSLNPVFLDDKDIGRRKRTASTVTYNVNVIDFHSEDEPHYSGSGGGGGNVGYGTGKRSNSSTSK